MHNEYDMRIITIIMIKQNLRNNDDLKYTTTTSTTNHIKYNIDINKQTHTTNESY